MATGYDLAFRRFPYLCRKACLLAFFRITLALDLRYFVGRLRKPFLLLEAMNWEGTRKTRARARAIRPHREH